jgi:uracil phosphoribosyltransferase
MKQPLSDAPLHVLDDHPLVSHLLSILRQQTTTLHRFRQVVRQLGGLLAYEAARELPTRSAEIQTPLETCEGRQIHPPLTLVSILRAGIGLTEGMLDLFPGARLGHLGMARDEETLEPVPYYDKIPPNSEAGTVFLVDPMLATGGSAVMAAEYLRARGCQRMSFLCLVAAPEGVRRFSEVVPEASIYTAALDRQLNEAGYILPGLGDAGDRQFGTG